MPAQVIFGDVRELDTSELRSALQEARITRIDTAARYANGESEKKIGRSRLPDDFTIDTKIVFIPPGDGTLSPEAIEKSIANSLEVMGMEKVNVLYCHAPDFVTPIAEQAKAFDEQYRKDRFTYLGVSNFPVSMIEEWIDVAEKNDYVQPSVYEGQYNLLCRGYETTLFPLLRKQNMAFTGFSPLAGGFLLGNFTADGHQSGSRFTNDQSPFMKWYNQPSMHEAIKQLRSISEKLGVGMDELSLRWLVYHSILSEHDAVILGASKVHQIEKNAAQIKKGPLSQSVVDELNRLWDVVSEEAMSIVEHEKYLLGRQRQS